MSGFEGLREIGQIALTVGDVAEAVEYYRDRLGLVHLFDAGGMAFFDCDGIRLMLGPGEESGGSGSILYYEVADIEAAHEALSDRGVEFVEGPRKVAELEGSALWLAFFRDPWSNVLALMSEVADPGAGAATTGAGESGLD